MVSKNCEDLRLCVLGVHGSIMANDDSYINYTNEDFKEASMLAFACLSWDNVETKVYTSTVSQEMNAKIEKLESQNEYLCGKLSNVDDIMERLTKLEEKN